MSDAAALLAAIRAAPDDDAPRLIYADWLEEHGQPERAEFIRVQCELARNDSPTLRQREAELMTEHHDVFAGPLAAPGLRFRFRRGFVTAFGHTGLFASDDHKWIFRFLPDSSVYDHIEQLDEDVHAMERPEHMAAFLKRRTKSHGRYELDGLSPVSAIHFNSFRNGRPIECRGLLQGATLRLEAVRGFKRVSTPLLLHLDDTPGYDSPQDSPQHAV